LDVSVDDEDNNDDDNDDDENNCLYINYILYIDKLLYQWPWVQITRGLGGASPPLEILLGRLAMDPAPPRKTRF